MIPEGLREDSVCFCISSVTCHKCDMHVYILGRLRPPTIPSSAAQSRVTKVLLTIYKQASTEPVTHFQLYI